ncbi:hypothetical protein HK096_011581 [Nowakowskiella sp. JEL0078]|nr:hypothetical protein HK096_011581 [Nowakowskiella sp. JEL0078]
MKISLAFFLLFVTSVFANNILNVDLSLLPPARLNVSNPNEKLTFDGNPIRPDSQTYKLTRNLTHESESQYRLHLIGMGMESELGSLSKKEKNFIKNRNYRRKKFSGYKNVSSTYNANTNASSKGRRALARRLSSAVSTTEASWLLFMAPTSAASYCANDQITAWTCDVCNSTNFKDLTSITTITKTAGCGEVQAYVGFSPKIGAIVVSFRGAKNAGNWLCNLNFLKCSSGLSVGGKVHCGFQEAWNGIRADVFKAILSIASPYWPNGASYAYPVFFVGHSLGGGKNLVC